MFFASEVRAFSRACAGFFSTPDECGRHEGVFEDGAHFSRAAREDVSLTSDECRRRGVTGEKPYFPNLDSFTCAAGGEPSVFCL